MFNVKEISRLNEDLNIVLVESGVRLIKTNFPDRDIPKGVTVFFTNLKNGEQGIKLSEILNKGDRFMLVNKRSGHVDLIASEYIGDNLVFITNLYFNAGATSRNGKTRKIIKDSFLINPLKKKVLSDNYSSFEEMAKGSHKYNTICTFKGDDLDQYSTALIEHPELSRDVNTYWYSERIFVYNFIQAYGQMYYMNGNSCNNFMYFSDIKSFLTLNEPTLSVGPKGQIASLINSKLESHLLDENNDDLKDLSIDQLGSKDDIGEHNNYWGPKQFMLPMTFECTHDNVSAKVLVFRGISIYPIVQAKDLKAYRFNNVKEFDFDEMFRIFYIMNDQGKENLVFMKKNNFGDWVNTTPTNKWNQEVLPVNKESLFGKLKYVDELFFDESYNAEYLISLMKNSSTLEKIAKSSDMFKDMISLLSTKQRLKYNIYTQMDFFERIEYILMSEISDEDSKKSVYNIIKINKYQLNKLEEFYEKYDNPFGIHVIKQLYYLYTVNFHHTDRVKSVDLRDVDNKTFDQLYTLMDLMFKHKESATTKADLLNSIPDTQIESLLMAVKTLDDIQFIIDNYEKILNIAEDRYVGGYRQSKISLFLDYRRIVESLNIRLGLNLKTNVRSVLDDNLQELHDDAVRLLNEIEHKHNDDAIRRRYEKLKHLEYEDDNFAIISPDTAGSIAAEGVSLKHCVSIYIDRVINGETAIFFMRQKNALDIPYFTIEVRNNEIIQAHGFANSNLETQDQLDFISNWAKDKKLKERRSYNRYN